MADKRSDAKLIALTALTLVLAAAAVAAGMLYLTRGSKVSCGEIAFGTEADMSARAVKSPYYLNGGGNCGFWATIEKGRLVAVKTTITGRDCTVVWKGSRDRFECGGVAVAMADLERWPSHVVASGGLKGAFVVDFGGTSPSSAPDGATSTTS